MRYLIIFLLISFRLSAQTDTLQIKTSAVCDQCKKTLENDISFVKGVKDVKLDVKSAILTVVYDASKVTPDKIRLAVTKSGYDADSLKADEKAYKRLSECCKKPMMHQE